MQSLSRSENSEIYQTSQGESMNDWVWVGTGQSDGNYLIQELCEKTAHEASSVNTFRMTKIDSDRGKVL